MQMKRSLKVKVVNLLIVFAVILSGISCVVSATVTSNMIDEQYRSKATEIAGVVAQAVDPAAAQELKQQVFDIFKVTENKVFSDQWGTPEFYAYLDHYKEVESSPAYQSLLQHLRKMQSATDVNCIYLTIVDGPTNSVIYLVDAALEDACSPGCMDPLYEVNNRVKEHPEVGFPAYITLTQEYGWLVTAASPVFAEDGTVICYAAADISMEAIRAQQKQSIYLILGCMVGLTVLTCIAAIVYVNHSIIRPVNMLSRAAAKYGQDQGKDNQVSFEKLDIHTGDELESLRNSMIQMERDIDSYIQNLFETREQLSSTRQRAEMMNELAHTDALTGLQNKLAYDADIRMLDVRIREGGRNIGIAMVDLNFLKMINDQYGHDKGDVAIVILSCLIRDVFAGSVTYRVGGDEFVVILGEEDCRNIEERVSEFNRRVKERGENMSLQPWERISAAIGYALYDETKDSTAEDIFRRADNAMYSNKGKMKALRRG